MKALDSYLTMLLGLPAYGEPSSVTTIQEISEKLNCTPRNVKLLIKKWSEQEWLTWQAGRGRGNRSQLLVHYPFAEAARDYCQHLIEKDKIGEALSFCNHPNFPAPLRDELQLAIQNRFGFQEQKSELSTQDIMRLPVRRRFSSLDPLLVSVSWEVVIVRNLFDTLVLYDEAADCFTPQLAHAWEVSSDKTVWTFYLRKRVRFHHGKVLTAQDVLYTFNRFRDPEIELAPRWLLDDVTGIEALDPHTVRFTLRAPSDFFLHIIASIHASILPSDRAVDQQQLVGTGAFRMEKNTAEHLVLEAFDDYFQTRARLDRVEFYYLPRNTPITKAFEVETSAGSLSEAENEIRIYEDGCRYLLFNLRRDGPAQDLLFRQAVHCLLDRQQMVSDLQGTRLIPASSFLPEQSRKHPFPTTSLAEAEKLLERSDYSGEEVRLCFFDLKEGHEDAQWIQQRAKEIGLHLTLHPFPISRMYEIEIEEACDLLLMGEIFETDRELSIVQLFRNATGFPRRLLSDSVLQSINDRFARFMTVPHREERMEIFLELEQWLAGQFVLLPNYHVRKKSMVNFALQGFKVESYGFSSFRKLWIKKSES